MGLWILFHSSWLFTLSVLAVMRSFWCWSTACLLYLGTGRMLYQPVQRRNAMHGVLSCSAKWKKQPDVHLRSLVGMAIAFSGSSHHITWLLGVKLLNLNGIYLKHVAFVVPGSYLSKCCSCCFFFWRHWLLLLFWSFCETQLYFRVYRYYPLPCFLGCIFLIIWPGLRPWCGTESRWFSCCGRAGWGTRQEGWGEEVVYRA